MKNTLALALIAVAATLQGCEPADTTVLPGPAPADSAAEQPTFGEGAQGHADFAEATFSRSEIAGGFARDGEWLVSAPLQAKAGATRVGALIHLQMGGERPALEAAGIDAAGGSTGWAPLATTFAEDTSFVAIVELPTTVTSARLRLLASDVDRIDQLVWNAVVPGDATEEPFAQVEGALAAELASLGVVSRAAWKAKATKCTTKDVTKTRMAIHYTVTPSDNPMARVRAVQAYHMDSLGWCDIGYHFLVGIDGSVYEGRPSNLLGAHVGGHNTGNIGVSFVGCFHPTGCSNWTPLVPPTAMLQAGALLLGELSSLYGVPLDTSHVKGHRDHPGQSTSCPGDNLRPRIPDLLAMAAQPGKPAPVPDQQPEKEPDPEPAPKPGPTSCSALSCGQCAAASGCGYCASQGTCQPAGAGCAWKGKVDTATCWSQLWPCWVASCWNPKVELAKCGSFSIDEDFSSGAYSVHRYWTTLPGGGTTTIRLQRTAGTFAPALLVTDMAGLPVAAGDLADLHPTVKVVSAASGRGGSIAEVALYTAQSAAVLVYVSGWSVIDAGFHGSLSKSSKYQFSAQHSCGTQPPPPPAPSDPISGYYAGLTKQGSEIPRKGLENPTLLATLGLSVEPLGEVVVAGGHSWVRGKASWFGGPEDGWISPTETGAITGELLRGLNDPMSPTSQDLASRPEDFYFVAMRWSYAPNGKSFWKNARLLVTNPATGLAVVVRPVDWGPSLSTGRIIDLSPQAMADLFLDTDGTVLISFAPSDAMLGPVQ